MRELPIFRPPFCGFLLVVNCFCGVVLGLSAQLMCHSGKQGVDIRLGMQLDLSPCLGQPMVRNEARNHTRLRRHCLLVAHIGGGPVLIFFTFFKNAQTAMITPFQAFPTSFGGNPEQGINSTPIQALPSPICEQ